FTIMGYAPYPMKIGVHQLGFVFFGWGVLVAIFAVFIAPRAQRAIGTAKSLYITLFLLTLDLAAIAVWIDRPTVIIVCVIVSGAFIGMNNTLVTATVMSVAPVPRPIASAAYSFVRFIGGGLAPWVAGILAARYSDDVPFYIGAGAVFASILVLATAHRLLSRGKKTETEQQQDEEVEELLEAVEGNVIHGHLNTRDGAPVAGAALTLIDHAGHQIARGVSAHDGYYNVTGLSDGNYVMIASAKGFRPEACPVTLTGQTVELSRTLGGASALRGTVNSSATGEPLQAATVTLVDSRGEVVEADRTDTLGHYSFGGVAAGEYTLAVSADGCLPLVRVVAMGEIGDVTVDIALAVKTPLRGVARSGSDGRPIAEALVTLVDSGGQSIGSVLTDPDGAYCFPAVGEGQYTLIASGYPPISEAVRIRLDGANRQDVTLGHSHN
ncbi:MAG: MFS transporter, partial [Sciscionella sp.]